MDAFSLSLAYGMYGLRKFDMILLSIIVSFYHFFMPLLGVLLGNFINNNFIVNVNLLVCFIFVIIGIEMIISSIKNESISVLVSFVSFLLFGLSVSLDSFTTGIGLRFINNNYLQVSFTFALVSGIFTYIGLKIGYKLNEHYSRYSTLFGGIMLICLGIYYLF